MIQFDPVQQSNSPTPSCIGSCTVHDVYVTKEPPWTYAPDVRSTGRKSVAGTMKHTSLRIPVDNGVYPLIKRCFKLLPFGSRLNGSGRCRNARDINFTWLFRLFLTIFGYLLLIVLLTNLIRSKGQIRVQLSAFGDVEKNPGPKSAEKLIFQSSSLKVTRKKFVNL
jgi:hypothetical protein